MIELPPSLLKSANPSPTVKTSSFRRGKRREGAASNIAFFDPSRREAIPARLLGRYVTHRPRPKTRPGRRGKCAMPAATTNISSTTTINGRVGCAILLFGYMASLFLSAFLLFSVQPLISRMALPRLGGSPSVWNTCVCFFEVALLLGYAYAHLVAVRLKLVAQIIFQGLALFVGLSLLPLSLGVDAPPTDAAPVGWLLARLTVAVGAPFVAVAATAPLLQSWFSRTTHPHARDPYFLYVASNAGSLFALLSYPILIETTLDLPGQARYWSIGFFLAVAAVTICGVVAQRYSAPLLARAATIGASSASPAERLRWVALAFVPSALMLAVTTYITTDVAATPLFWVAPLAIYIATFIFAFARRQFVSWRTLLVLQGAALAGAALCGLINVPIAIGIPISLSVFALTAAVCHTELAQRRPDAAHLTGYFLFISLGGSLGGLFGALLAPLIFPGPWEYPLLLVAACLLRPPPSPLPTRAQENWAIRGDLLLPVALTALAIALLWVAGPAGPEALRPVARIAAIALLGIALLRFSRRRMRLAMAMASCLLFPAFVDTSDTLAIKRSFFGVHRVRSLPNENLIVLQHGTTVHGMQSTRPGEEFAPIGYYDASGPFGRLFATLARRESPITSVGVFGLGAGGLGCYAKPGESWTFREIDPAVVRLAREERWFHFLSGCGNRPSIILGDARLTLAADASSRYDLLIIDAFSSDSVPVHLITREALALYFAHLKPHGIVLFHVSNRYLDLTPVVARLAAEANAPVRHLLVRSRGESLRRIGVELVAVAAPGGELDALVADGWDAPQPGPVLWTDERSEILGVIRWR